jgi:hypothetical protein
MIPPKKNKKKRKTEGLYTFEVEELDSDGS